MERWAQIYRCAEQIRCLDPWSRFRERDLFVWQPRDHHHEYFFRFLWESSTDRGIAFYENANDCFLAQERLLGKNEKKEPVFLLQNAVILLWSDREVLSKSSYRRIKELGLKFRGKGCWPHFQKYRIGFLPQDIPGESVEQLSQQIENLLEMLKSVSQSKSIRLTDDRVLLHSYHPHANAYLTYVAPLTKRKCGLYPKIVMQDSDRLRQLKQMKRSGAIAIDWAFCPGTMAGASGDVIPRLALAVNTRTGSILEKRLFSPESTAPEDMLFFLEHVIGQHGKPVSIEICDREIEAYICDLCSRVGIRLTLKPRLRNIEILRRAQLAELNVQDAP